MKQLVLLGPQRLNPTLAQVVQEIGVEGPIATITAGWQEREDEVDELSHHLGHPLVNLRLYHRADQLFLEDDELWAAYRERQNRLKSLQIIYRKRLEYTLAAARRVFREKGDEDILGPERDSVIEELKRLDAHHLKRVETVRQDYEGNWSPWDRPRVEEHRDEIREILAKCGAVAIAGGHVATLLNRLRLLGVMDLIEDQHILAWSAGAMVLGERIVLFHDNPPQGAGNAEVLEPGFGFYQGIVPLPHAHRRLRLDDRRRVAIFARRFAPARSLVMADGSWISINGNSQSGIRDLCESGDVIEGGPCPALYTH